MSPLLQAPVLNNDPVCPECNQPFEAKNATQFFCCPEHRNAYTNLWTVRGRRGMVLFAVARKTRNGSRPGSAMYSDRAGRDADYLLRQWAREDAAANDGRGRMELTEYNRRRYALGFEPF